MLEGTGHFHNKDDTGNRSSYRSRKESRHRYDDDIRVKERVKKSQSDHDIADNAAGERSDDKHRQKEAAGDAAAVAEHCKDEFTCQQQQ